MNSQDLKKYIQDIQEKNARIQTDNYYLHEQIFKFQEKIDPINLEIQKFKDALEEIKNQQAKREYEKQQKIYHLKKAIKLLENQNRSLSENIQLLKAKIPNDSSKTHVRTFKDLTKI